MKKIATATVRLSPFMRIFSKLEKVMKDVEEGRMEAKDANAISSAARSAMIVVNTSLRVSKNREPNCRKLLKPCNPE